MDRLMSACPTANRPRARARLAAARAAAALVAVSWALRGSFRRSGDSSSPAIRHARRPGSI
ncbi:hypothetical protein BE15_18675 [Sorangium cellulosum]|uniref:Uncharacterized protein n=1 Tax=Sorangium cellulosum TaxID=56 RepID=A0A150Q731_SORCE|nr:hypothetical protein BE15_18675 [Sorangium cellulosum]